MKTTLSARGCIREAIAQLLEYSFWLGVTGAEKLIVVGGPRLDHDARKTLALFSLSPSPTGGSD